MNKKLHAVINKIKYDPKHLEVLYKKKLKSIKNKEQNASSPLDAALTCLYFVG